METFSILLVLKDRSSYTQRLMDTWNSERFPYEIIIADGGSDEAIEQRLSNKSNFSNLDYTYLRYPFDKTLDNFYAKMSDAVMKIKTSTVSVMDNDDFINVDGIKQCLEILEDVSYSSARGAMQDMSGNNMYSAFPDCIVGNTAAQRMIDQTKHFHGNWHNITRTNHIQAEWRMIEVVSPNNFRVVEQIAGYLNALWGDGYRGDFPWMMHDMSERIKTEAGPLSSHFPDQVSWINADYWLEEFNKLTEVVGSAISFYDKIPVADAMKIFRESYHFKLPQLKNLLDSRINEAFSLGYNYNRIDKMFTIMKDCAIL